MLRAVKGQKCRKLIRVTIGFSPITFDTAQITDIGAHENCRELRDEHSGVKKHGLRRSGETKIAFKRFGTRRVGRLPVGFSIKTRDFAPSTPPQMT